MESESVKTCVGSGFRVITAMPNTCGPKEGRQKKPHLVSVQFRKAQKHRKYYVNSSQDALLC